MTPATRTFPKFFATAIVLSLLPYPGTYLIDRLTRQESGDHLSGTFWYLLFFVALFVGMLVLLRMGSVRDEQPRWLMAIPFLVLMVSLAPLTGIV